MKNKRTYYQLILDRSGSMSSCIEQTVSGVNGQISRIRELAERFPEQELFTSLTLFNQQVNQAWTRVRPDVLREIDYSDYKPDGFTALLDAVGMTLNDMQKTIGPEIGRDEATAVVVIITDGHENASRQFTHEQVASLIRELELTGKWLFSYLGATLDAVEIAVSLNIRQRNAVYFNVADTKAMHDNLSSGLSGYISQKQSGRLRKGLFEDDE